jgi:regulator of sigma E protease
VAYLISFLAVSFVILFHEFGHLIVARRFGIAIRRFSIGVGPVIARRRIGATDYCLSAFPLGGYVLPAVRTQEEYLAIRIRHRVYFSLGGPLANIALAVILAALANAWEGDWGVHGLLLQPFAQIGELINSMVEMVPAIFSAPARLSGIIGVVADGERFVGTSVASGLRFTSLLSINLAVLNLLPLPPLDGGKIVLSLLERVHHQAARLQLPMSLAGWALVFGMIVYITVLDIRRLLAGA